MATPVELVGRETERGRLTDAFESARRGAGSLVLLAGEAGVGKTRLAEELARGARAPVLWGRTTHGAGAPYGPIVAALRAFLRANPDGLSDCGPLRPHLALILPELGEPAPASDAATLFEAVRGALEHIADRHCALVVIDDLQWSDEA